jgi:phage tail protein X
MSVITATAHADEPLDLLVWRTLGTYSGTVEATLDANPGLASLGPTLPEGTVVAIPLPVAPAQVAPLVQLWS